MYDMSKCPQNETEFRDYFYALIGRTMGAPANDFEAVLSASYPWNGQMLMIPPGVGPNIQQQPGAPFYGLTQQYSGGPKARVFLPASTPDELGYYTRCMQYVDDAVGTYSRSKKQPAPKATGLIWAWYLAGPDNAYTPIGGSSTTPGTGGLTQEQVQAMIDASIQTAISNFNGLQFGDKIALRTNSGLLSGIKGGGPTQADAPIEWIGKTGDAHAWESFTIEKGE